MEGSSTRRRTACRAPCRFQKQTRIIRMNKTRIDGVVPVIPTPFTANEEIHEDDLRRTVEFAIASNATSVCLPAYGSEFYKMNERERHRVVQIAVKQSRGRVSVLAQSNHPSAKIAAEIARKNE